MKAIACVVLSLLCVAFVGGDGGAGGEDDGRARLLVGKQILNKLIVEGLDVVVHYSIYNIGSAAATNINLVDHGFSDNARFQHISGQFEVKIDRLAPGANMTHTVVVQPKLAGLHNFTAAQVSYKPIESGTETVVGYSSEPGEGFIFAFKDYDKKFSPHVLDWAAFAVMTLPSLGIPFLLWWSSKSKYERILQQKRERKAAKAKNDD